MEERCKGGLPESTCVTSPINIEPGCLLDAGNYQIEGIYQTNKNSTQREENLPAPVILPQLEMAADMNMSGIFLDYPHLQEMKIPSFHQIDDILEMHAEKDVINALKDSVYQWYEDWSISVIGLLALITLLGVAWFTYQKCHCPKVRPKETPKEKDVPVHERHPPEHSPLNLYVSQLMKELKEPTFPAPVPPAAGQCASVQDTQRALRDLHGLSLCTKNPSLLLPPQNSRTRPINNLISPCTYWVTLVLSVY